MNSDSNIRTRTRDVAALAAPLLAVQAVALIAGTSPSPTLATPANPIAEIEVPSGDPFASDAGLLAARAQIETLRDAHSELGSPMMVKAALVEEVEPGLPVADTVDPFVSEHGFELTTLTRGRAGEPLARIDGTLVGEGHAIADGWRVRAIDLAGRTVTIAHEDGTESVLTLGPF